METNYLPSLIFDFDGTLADSFDEFIAIFCALTHRDRPSAEEIESLRQLSAAKVMRQLNIPGWRLPWLIMRGRSEMSQRMDRVNLFPQLSEVLPELTRHYRLYIVSTNSQANIMSFLQRYQLADAFTGIYGGSSLFGKHKSLLKLLRRNQLVANQCLYIGDEVRDVAAAHRAGLRCLTVTWGYNHERILQQAGPEALVATPADLPAAIQSLLPLPTTR